MSGRDPKRRRLTPVNAPFRSPLRRRSAPPSQSDPQSSSSGPSSSSASVTPHSTPQRTRTPRQFRSPALAPDDERGLTPETLALIHRKRDLATQIKEETKAIETAELALKYEKQVRSSPPIPQNHVLCVRRVPLLKHMFYPYQLPFLATWTDRG